MTNQRQRRGALGVVRNGPSCPYTCDNRMKSPRRFLLLALLFLFTPVAYAADIPKPPDANRFRGDVAKMRSGSIRVKDPEGNKADWAKNQKSIDTVAEWL